MYLLLLRENMSTYGKSPIKFCCCLLVLLYTEMNIQLHEKIKKLCFNIRYYSATYNFVIICNIELNIRRVDTSSQQVDTTLQEFSIA